MMKVFAKYPKLAIGFGEGDDDVKVQIAKAVEDAVAAAQTKFDTDTAGLKSKVDEALKEKKTLAGKLAAFEGFDPKVIKTMMSRFENDEEAKLLAEGKIDEVVIKRLERAQADFTAKTATLQEQVDSLTGENTGWKSKYNTRTVETVIRAAAEKAGVLPAAIDDVIRRSANVFMVGEDDALESRDKDGNLRMSADGKDVLSPKVFINELKETAAHYFPGSQGAGAGGSGGQGHKQSDIDVQLDKAAEANDMTTYKRLRDEKKKAQSGR